MLNNPRPQPAIHQKPNFKEYRDMPITLSFNNFYSIIWIEHYGKASINFESETFKGQYLVFLSPEEIMEVKGAGALNIIMIPVSSQLIKTDYFSYSFGNLKKVFQLIGPTGTKVGMLLVKLKQLLNNNGHENLDKSQTILSAILDNNSALYGKSNTAELKLVYEFISLVNEHYKMQHEMSFYAENLCLPAKQITEKFYLLGIISPNQFIKKRVLVEAKRQLLYMDKAVKDIAFDIGFNDSDYFLRFFKKNTGMTTTEFRESNK